MGFNFAALRSGFFDASGIVKRVAAAKRKAFGKAGAFVRQRAKTSIKKKKKGTSPAGSPPYSHAGQLRLIFFSWDAKAESVVVGPILFAATRGPKQGAKLQEHGGEATYQDGKGRTRHARYPARPFMLPALKAELPKFAGLFKGSLGG
jgi:hypothetical protein